ncbi:efflux RND transporter permease subunit, partial [Salmonella enterica]|uniref:efflux RND transporter permease subunit n=1 Tax=Salmonella enterica TaxID=28901 RepID=UPI001F3318E1
PFSVMLVVPLGVVGALLAASLRGLNNDVYFQVGLLTTIGLSATFCRLLCRFPQRLFVDCHAGCSLFSFRRHAAQSSGLSKVSDS